MKEQSFIFFLLSLFFIAGAVIISEMKEERKPEFVRIKIDVKVLDSNNIEYSILNSSVDSIVVTLNGQDIPLRWGSGEGFTNKWREHR